jgi:hypothetical protein
VSKHLQPWTETDAAPSCLVWHADELLAFVKKDPSGVYETDKKSGGQPHAVAVVGYNNAQNYWIVKQSYGPDFAQGGFHKVWALLRVCVCVCRLTAWVAKHLATTLL